MTTGTAAAAAHGSSQAQWGLVPGMTGIITKLHRDRGTGSVAGGDGKTYMFRRNVVRDVWFHDLSEGATVSFAAAEPNQPLEATIVRPLQRSRTQLGN